LEIPEKNVRHSLAEFPCETIHWDGAFVLNGIYLDEIGNGIFLERRFFCILFPLQLNKFHPTAQHSLNNNNMKNGWIGSREEEV
jgi:hypothetical protein